MKTSAIIDDKNQRAERDALMERVLVNSRENFDALALDIFKYQYRYNPLYRQFCQLIGRTPDVVSNANAIPHLPIALFKSNTITTGSFEPEVIFESSGTTGQITSKHAVGSLEFYDKVSEIGFESVFGSPVSAYRWYGLLPSYLERPNSSLVHMVRHFISLGGGGFYLDNMEELVDRLDDSGPTILIGVTFALLDLAESYKGMLEVDHIVETGGMKGRRQELTREEVHLQLTEAFDRDVICSEYGMTELLSQGWSKGNGVFECSPTLRVSARDTSDPMCILGAGERGAINCTDLANIDSCAFIATEDAGVVYDDGKFEVHGRLDGSEQRGCNLMYPV